MPLEEDVGVRSEVDLTTGSIPRGVLSIALPMIGASIFHSIQSLVDMKFVAILGSSSIAAVGMAGQVMFTLIAAFMGLSTATVAMVSRAVGAGDEARASHVAGQALTLAVILSVGVGGAGFLASPLIMRILGARPDVAELGMGYLYVVFSGMFFLMAAFILGGILRGAGDAVTPLLLGILTTVLNVILNPIFIFGSYGVPAMGVRGSAVATVLARFFSFAVGAWVLLGGRLRVKVRRADFVPNPATMWRLVTIGVPSSIQMMIRSFMSLVLMSVVAQFGTLVIAAYTVGMRVRMLGLMPSFGFAGAAATMVGQNLGAGKPERSEKSAYTAVGMAVGVSICAASAFALFAPWLVAFFKDDPTVVPVGTRMLRITSVGIIMAPIGIIFGRSMNGAGDTTSPLVITLLALWGFQIPAAIWLSGVEAVWGVPIPFRSLFASVATGSETGIWYAMIAASALQAVICTVWFRVGRWKRKKV